MIMNHKQREVCKQSERILFIKLEILDTNLNVVREMTGKMLNDGNYTIAAKTGMRRTCNISMLMDEETIPSPSSPIWINKRFRAYTGIKDLRTDEIIWFPIGTFAISNPTRNIEINGKDVLKIKGVDFVAFMDGTLGGSLDKNIKILRGNKIHNTLRDTMNELTNYQLNISESKYSVPYEFEKKIGDKQWDIISELINFYMNYEGYFDEYGTFIFHPTSTLIDDSVVWDFSIPENNLIIDANIDYEWDDVRNRIMVKGREKDGLYPSYTCVALSTMKGWEDCPFTIDKLGEITAFDYKVPQKYVDIAWNNIQSETNTNTVLGKLKMFIIEKGWGKNEAIDNTIGAEVRQMLLGQITESTLEMKLKSYGLLDYFTDILRDPSTSDYRANPRSLVIEESKYFKVEQCITRGQYELDKRLACAEKIKITIVPIYGLDVNQVIYLDLTINDVKLKGKYCIDNISCKLGYNGKMDITCHKVTKNRFGFDQSLLHQKDENWMYTGEIVEIIDFDGSTKYLTENKDMFGRIIAPMNSIFSQDLIYKYRLSLLDQYKLKDLMDFCRDSIRFFIDKKNNEIIISISNERHIIKRDKYRNWYTDEFLFGKDLILNKGWQNEKPDELSSLPLFWEKYSEKIGIRVHSQQIIKCSHYLPYWVIEDFNLSEHQAKELGLVGLVHARRTDEPFKFGHGIKESYNSVSFYMCFLEADGTNLYVVDGYEPEITQGWGKHSHILKRLHRDENGVWYTDEKKRRETDMALPKRVYGNNLYKTGDFTGNWVGYQMTDISQMEKDGYLRIDYEEVMNGTIELSN